MQRETTKRLWKTLGIGTTLAIIIMLIGFLFMNPSECPDGYSQAQINASGCRIGANIGLGLMVIAAGAIFVMTVVATLLQAFLSRNKKK